MFQPLSTGTRPSRRTWQPLLAAALALLPFAGAHAQHRALPLPDAQPAGRATAAQLLSPSGPLAPAAAPAARPVRSAAASKVLASISSTAAGGNWSDPATWVGGAVPSATDDVTIVGGATVTLDVAATAASLTVAATGSLLNSATTSYSLTVGGSVTNDGTLDLSTSATIGSDLRFTAAGNASFTGTGTTDLQSMTLAKSVRADVVEMTLPSFTVQGGAPDLKGFLLTRTTGTTPVDDMTGTLKISGTATISARVFGSAAAYIIPATGAFWLNNPNFTVSGQTGSANVFGQLRISAGTYNVGTAAGNSIVFNPGSVLTVEGGALNAAGRVGNFTSGTAINGTVTFAQSGGAISVATVGNASGIPSFGFAGNINMSGGTVNLVQRSTATTPLDYYVAGTTGSTQSYTGGTVVAGSGATATNFDFRLRGTLYNLTIDATTNPKSAVLAAQLVAVGTVTVPATTTLNLNGFLLLAAGPSIVNNGTLIGNTTGSTLYFGGSIPQTLSGAGTFTLIRSISVDNSGGGATLTVPVVAARVNLFTGNLNGTNNLTIGDGSGTFFVIQIGVTGNPGTSGSLTSAPTFNIGSGALQLIYAPETTARTTGFEIPATRIVDGITISNPAGVILAGGNLTVNASGVSTASLILTSGILTTSAGNVLTLGTAAATIPTGSATSYVKGPLGITVNSATAVSRTFAVGDAAGWRPVVVNGITTSSSQVYTATVVNGATGGSGILLTPNPTRYVRLENTANLPATATVQLSYGADDTGISTTSVVAQAATANGTYASLGGAPATVPTTGIVSTQNLTPGNDFFVLANPAACDPNFSYAAAAYCTTGTNPTPTAPASSGGTFSSTAGLTINATTGQITLSTSTPGTYTVTYSVGSNCSATATVTITAPATAGFSYAASPYCTTTTGTVAPTLATGATAGTFTSTTGLTIDAATGAITPSTSTPGTYTVTNTVAASGGCTGVTSTATVTITAPATANFSYANASYCTTATGTAAATLTTGATAGTFTSTTGLTLDAATGAITPGTSTPGTYTVTNTVAASGGCAAVTATATVTITAPATAGFSYAASPYCTTTTGTVAAALATGATPGTFTSTTGLTINATTGAITPSTSTPGTYTVTNTVAASGGCAQVTATATVTITAPASASFSYATASYCVSGTNPAPVVPATSTAGTFSSTAGLSLNATTGVINLAASTPGTYTVTNTVAASGGCAAVTATFAVTITAAPVATFSYASAAYCVGSANPAPVVPTTSTAGTFSSTTGLVISASGVINLATSAPGTYTVTNTVAAAGGCAQVTATFAVTINARPATPTLTAQYNGPTTTLTSSAATGNQFYLNGTLIPGATGQTYVVNSAPQYGAYTVVVTNPATGCSSLPSSVLTVTTAAKPLAGSSLRVFPNPTPNGQLSVELSGYRKAVELTVYNTLGQPVYSATVPASAGNTVQPVSLSALPAGVYILRAKTDGGLDTRRIVKE